MSDSESENAPEEMSDSDSEEEISAKSHSASLKRLKDKDPDFYDFLKENEKELLDFKPDDDDLDDEEQEISDDSDDDESTTTSKGSISKNKLEFIAVNIESNPSVNMIKELISAFKHAVQQAEGGTSSKTSMSNSDLFDKIMKICLIHLVPALQKVLKLEENKKSDPKKSKLWKKLHVSIKGYLIDMLKMYSIMKDPSISTLLLKHTVHLVPFCLPFAKISRVMVKKMISMWCHEEETVRVLSLIVIIRITKSFPKGNLSQILKAMYFAYIKNTKFTSPTTWPMINFMKKSLTEIYALNPELAYEHGFIYIRQMSIHLRNALTTKKKDSMQTVYNWQYIHCILLWAEVLCRLHEHEAIKGLIYPLVQTTIGTLNLLPISKFVPLRFHLVTCLMHISKSTETFIPTLPFILNVLNLTDFNKKSGFSVKPVDFSCALKVTKSQLLEAGFKEACITEVCNKTLEYLKIYGHSIGFPELALPAVVQIKAFIKKCKVPKYIQLLKGVLQKIDENVSFISDKRKSVSFGISDLQEVKKWENDIKSLGVPISRAKEANVDAETSPKKATKRPHEDSKKMKSKPSKKKKFAKKLGKQKS